MILPFVTTVISDTRAAASLNTVLGLDGKMHLTLDFCKGLGCHSASKISVMKVYHAGMKNDSMVLLMLTKCALGQLSDWLSLRNVPWVNGQQSTLLLHV